jgi:L-2-hydroxyglutarate oxidase
MNKFKCDDVIVIGGGIIGLSIARSLGHRFPTKTIRLIEKEIKFGLHNSSMNSGVIHAGLYYPTDSGRARYCVKGNRLLTDYHIEKKIAIKETGKLILPRNEEESLRLLKLYDQGRLNGVQLQLLNIKEALKIEKHLKIHGDFPVIYSPTTKIGNPQGVIENILNDINSLNNVNTTLNSEFNKLLECNESHIVFEDSNNKVYETKYLINAAGLYSDKIAKHFNLLHDHLMLPIQGTYLLDCIYRKRQPDQKMKTLVYPVPPPLKGSNFLGIHTTITSDDCLKLGPTALPCFWRQQHRGLNSFNFEEMVEILQLYLSLLSSNKKSFYLRMIINQLTNMIKKNVLEQGKSLTTIYDDLNDYRKINKIFHSKLGGIRPQLINMKTKELENDFIIIKKTNQLHILNMISPGWTCALAIAEDITL